MTDQSVYQGGFSSWKDVLEQFHGRVNDWDDDGKKASFAKLVAEQPEPKKVYFANYDDGGYDGAATVIWSRGKKFYFLSGSHCSCYGLEETGFTPEEFPSKKVFIEFLKKARFVSGMTDDQKEELIRKLGG